MPALYWIVAATLIGGLLSVAAAAAFTFRASPARVAMLVSFAVGALLGVAFLEILPHAFELSGDIEKTAATVLAGILLFFVLEKLVLWRHCHHEQCEAHDSLAVGTGDRGRSGLLIIIGDTFHNFVDGIIIAAAFLADIQLGIVTSLAIIAHEIPQETGDFFILLHSGYSRSRALLFNLVSSMAMLVGAVIAYFALQTMQQWVPALLALAGASMIYVAVADLIPGLHKRPRIADTIQQAALIALGIAVIALVRQFE
ncbi:MAG: ZIP family metal transporter [Burkholderiales bacterium]|nr:ZIP family metal transporter [Burkholderiales bacterium]